MSQAIKNLFLSLKLTLMLVPTKKKGKDRDVEGIRARKEARKVKMMEKRRRRKQSILRSRRRRNNLVVKAKG